MVIVAHVGTHTLCLTCLLACLASNSSGQVPLVARTEVHADLHVTKPATLCVQHTAKCRWQFLTYSGTGVSQSIGHYSSLSTVITWWTPYLLSHASRMQ